MLYLARKDVPLYSVFILHCVGKAGSGDRLARGAQIIVIGICDTRYRRVIICGYTVRSKSAVIVVVVRRVYIFYSKARTEGVLEAV